MTELAILRPHQIKLSVIIMLEQYKRPAGKVCNILHFTHSATFFACLQKTALLFTEHAPSNHGNQFLSKINL